MRRPWARWSAKTLWLFVILALAGIGGIHPGGAVPPEASAGGEAAGVGSDPDLILLPFANFTGTSEAVAVLGVLMRERIAAKGIRCLAETDLRPILRQNRIRSVGKIGGADARLLREQTGAEFLMLGSYDLFRAGQNPEVALSIRLVDSGDLTVVASHSAAATGEDYAGLFGVGRVDSVGVLAVRVLDGLFAELTWPPVGDRPEPGPAGPCRKIALVPFDNLSEQDHAGRIMTNILLSELVSEGYVILEPGLLHEHFLARQVMPRGGIDLVTLASVHRELGSCWVLTGEVARFHPALGDPQEAVPELGWGARLLDARTGQLLTAVDLEADGGQSESLFRLGRRHSLGELARDSAAELLNELRPWMETDLAEAE